MILSTISDNMLRYHSGTLKKIPTQVTVPDFIKVDVSRCK